METLRFLAEMALWVFLLLVLSSPLWGLAFLLIQAGLWFSR